MLFTPGDLGACVEKTVNLFAAAKSTLTIARVDELLTGIAEAGTKAERDQIVVELFRYCTKSIYGLPQGLGSVSKKCI